MPRGNTINNTAPSVSHRPVFRQLEAHVLNGVRVDLRADEAFNGVQQTLVPERVEHRGPDPNWRILPDAAGREREIEMLVQDALGFLTEPDEPFAERLVSVGGRNRAVCVEFAGKAIEHAFIFPDNRIEITSRIEEPLDDNIAFVIEARDLFGSELCHGILNMEPR